MGKLRVPCDVIMFAFIAINFFKFTHISKNEDYSCGYFMPEKD